MAVLLVALSATVTWEGYLVLATPSPSIGQVVTPGVVGPCDYFISMDGTTPVAHFQSNKGGTPGDNLVGTPGQDTGAFLNSITATGINFCLGGNTFSFSTTWILQTGDNVDGVFNKTLFQPTVNSFDMVGITHPAVGATAATNILFRQISFASNGHTSVNGINLNRSISETASSDDVGYLQFYGTGFNYLVIMDGNEASLLHDVFVGTSQGNALGEISFKVAGGEAAIDNVQYDGAGGQASYLHLMAQQFIVTRSTINGIVLERQTFAYLGGGATSWQFTFGELDVKDTYMANGDPGGISRIQPATGQTISVLTLTLTNDYIGLGSNGGLFAAVGTGSNLNMNNVRLTGNLFTQITGTAFWFTKGGSAGGGTMGRFHWDPSNYVTGTISVGDVLTTGLCSSFAIRPEPVGWAPENSPGVPAGTGIGNAVQQCEVPWPIIVYMNITTSAGAVQKTGAHIIDFATNTDNALLANTQTAILYPGDKIYFTSFVPYAWQWYGSQW
jgi:hypothetical protein